MQRGRKPKPTHLKILAGNPGKRPLPQHEPKPVGDLSEAPDWFSESQRTGWEYVMKHAPRGLLKRLDRSVLAIWVVAEDLHRQAAIEVAKGNLTSFTEKGGEVQSPYVAILNNQARIMLKAAADLGFSPAARPRIEVKDEGGQGQDEEERFFGS